MQRLITKPLWEQLAQLQFFSGSARFSKKTISREKNVPTPIYIQSPIAWLVNKIDFRMLKAAWDSEFDENEFKRGAKQAVSVISRAIAENNWEILQGLVTRQALRRLKREIETGWSEAQRIHVALEPCQLKIALTRRIRFTRIGGEKLVNVDSVFLGLKYADSACRNLIFIETAARFHRNYSLPPASTEWTVSAFKVTGFRVDRCDGEE